MIIGILLGTDPAIPGAQGEFTEEKGSDQQGEEEDFPFAGRRGWYLRQLNMRTGDHQQHGEGLTEKMGLCGSPSLLFSAVKVGEKWEILTRD